jgi:putative transposase
LHKTIRDIRNDLLHKFTTWVSQNYRFIGIENLHGKGMTHNHCLALSLQDAALGKLLRLLEHKVQSRGGQVIRVERAFPSSKLCSNCGHKQD